MAKVREVLFDLMRSQSIIGLVVGSIGFHITDFKEDCVYIAILVADEAQSSYLVETDAVASFARRLTSPSNVSFSS